MANAVKEKNERVLSGEDRTVVEHAYILVGEAGCLGNPPGYLFQPLGLECGEIVPSSPDLAAGSSPLLQAFDDHHMLRDEFISHEGPLLPAHLAECPIQDKNRVLACLVPDPAFQNTDFPDVGGSRRSRHLREKKAGHRGCTEYACLDEKGKFHGRVLCSGRDMMLPPISGNCSQFPLV